MTSLFDLLSQNQENDKVLSTLRKIAGKKTGSASKRPEKPSNSAGRGKRGFEELINEFVAIDVETTGLDPKNDRIIELAAVRYHAGKINGEFSTLINPGVAIPSHITRLTGISDADVSTSPVFADIAEAFLDFIGKLPVCGHQIEFDLNFLASELKRLGREKISSPEIDTALLSRLVVPAIGRFALKNVATALDITLDNAHRALADAKASGFAALALYSRLHTIAPGVRAACARFAPPSIIKSMLLASNPGHGESAHHFLSGREQPEHKKLSPSATRKCVSVNTIKDFFIGGGELSKAVQNFAQRPSQTEMAVSAVEALNCGSMLVAEAGTGIGKSLAYLIPCALYAMANDCRILVSTHTRNLQDQLISKDLPIVKNVCGPDLRYGILKGRSNYLCVRQFHKLLSGDLTDLSYRERMGLLPLIRWAFETHTGDIEEQNQFNIKWFSRIWRQLCADAHRCEGKRCALFNECFLQKARQGALGAHIVVINHALFFSELCSASSFLGPLGAMVFDEAHHLESCGHRYLRVEVDTNRLTQYVDSLTHLEKELKSGSIPKAPDLGAADVKTLIKRIRQATAAFLNDCGAWVENQHPSGEEYQIAYPSSLCTHLASYTGLATLLAETQGVLHQLQQLAESESEREEGARLMKQNLRLLSDKTSQLKADLDYLANASLEDHVFWIEGNRRKGWMKLCGVPLDIAGILSPLWQANAEACIFTSATLAVSGSLEYFKQKIGLCGPNEAKTRGEIFKGAFHPNQSFRAAITGGPEPDAAEYPEYVASVIVALTCALRKNALVLFTSIGMLETVYERCKQLSLPPETTVLAQGISGNRQAILDEFKHSTCGILLGADSFWEGIDAPGKACELVIIPRLPFHVPTHPLFKALADRIERQEGQSFFSFAVPEAIIKFRQGIGRLIRTVEDKGAAIVLDKRIATKNYGKRFCSSVEGGIQPFTSIDEMLKPLADFFKEPIGPAQSCVRYVPLEEA